MQNYYRKSPVFERSIVLILRDQINISFKMKTINTTKSWKNLY